MKKIILSIGFFGIILSVTMAQEAEKRCKEVRSSANEACRVSTQRECNILKQAAEADCKAAKEAEAARKKAEEDAAKKKAAANGH